MLKSSYLGSSRRKILSLYFRMEQFWAWYFRMDQFRALYFKMDQFWDFISEWINFELDISKWINLEPNISEWINFELDISEWINFELDISEWINLEPNISEWINFEPYISDLNIFSHYIGHSVWVIPYESRMSHERILIFRLLFDNQRKWLSGYRIKKKPLPQISNDPWEFQSPIFYQMDQPNRIISSKPSFDCKICGKNTISAFFTATHYCCTQSKMCGSRMPKIFLEAFAR